MEIVDLMLIKKEEKESSGLTELPEDFYKKVKDELAKKVKELSESDWESRLDLLREFENFRNVFLDIVRIRMRKILSMIEFENIPNLTEEEKEFLREVKESYEKWFSKLTTQEEKKVKLKILKDITTQYRGADGKIYGPFRGGEVVELPEEEASFLVKNGYGEVISDEDSS